MAVEAGAARARGKQKFTFICPLGKTRKTTGPMDTLIACLLVCLSLDLISFCQVKSSHYINNRQPITGSLSKVLSKLAVEVRVDGEDETDLT